MDSLKHDIAFEMSKNVVGIFVNLLRPEEQRAALWEVYEVVLKGLESYDIKANRRLARLSPTKN